jgi:hypothetical protein
MRGEEKESIICNVSVDSIGFRLTKLAFLVCLVDERGKIEGDRRRA